jgi:transketolase
MPQTTAVSLDQLAINTIRFLAVDMVEKGKSGHPGAPLGQAPMAYLLWNRRLRHNPKNPSWIGRDRFVLSCGHASALLYALLHLTGYDLPMEQLQRFRQIDSQTPGHPEHGLAPGVETTTGPLGQGFGNAVGMAIARELLAARFDRPGFPLFDYRIWVFASDGDLMEGVASEAASLAGHLRLASLKVFYDDNDISIDGPTSLAFTEDAGLRFEAYGWRVERVEDGNDLDALDAAIAAAESESERPTLVVVRTHIGYGSPKKQDTAEAHGEPLGPEETKATKENLGWPLEPAFFIPEEARQLFAQVPKRGAELEAAWNDLRARWAAAHPAAAAELERRERRELPAGWDSGLPDFKPGEEVATRDASGKALDALSKAIPELVGGSADLTPSNKTLPKGEGDFSADNRAARYLRFGVREHAMGSALSGIALSGLLIPYGGTFLIFSDYMRPAIRLAALMEQHVVYVFTHDSIFLGEDGPTHQPIEHHLALRAIPHLVYLRPADACETVEAWRWALTHRGGPVALALTRQKVPVLAPCAERARAGLPRGGYVLADPAQGDPQGILMATGSEVHLILEAHAELAKEGIATRVVSLPSWELFDGQDDAYRESVLPAKVTRRLAVEAGTPLGWERYVGPQGGVLGRKGFGASAPYKDVAKKFGFTVPEVMRRARALLS